MPLFRKRPREPVEHPPVERTIHLRSELEPLPGHVEQYSSIMGARGRALHLTVEHADDWLRFRLPTSGVHPWEAANLAFWLLELGEVIYVSAATPWLPSHWLVRAEAGGDLLEGWTSDGEPMTIHIPDHRIIRHDMEVAVPRACAAEHLAASGVPSAALWHPTGTLTVKSEDPQRDLAPTMNATARDRSSLRSWLHDGI